MKQRNTNTHTPKTGNTKPVADTAAQTSTVVAMRPAKGQRKNWFETAAMPIKEGSNASEAQELSKARQLLAEASDLYAAGVGKEAEANEVAAKAATILIRERMENVITPEQLTATLGDTFGFKNKTGADKPPVSAADPNASKTPYGKGEAIRKRIVRAYAANEYVNGRDGGAFFNNLPVDAVKDTLHKLNNGQLGFWAAYEEFAAIKRDNNHPVPAAFNAKTIQGIVEALGGEGVAAIFVENSALRTAYRNLYRLLPVIGEEVAAMLPEEVAA